jgi:futalosine hydrolase
MTRLLFVTAVEVERAALGEGLTAEWSAADTDLPAEWPAGGRDLAVGRPAGRDLAVGRPTGRDPAASLVVIAGGVGPAAAAAATARALALAETGGAPFTLVVSAGIAGGFAGRVEVGATVLARRSVAADLGARTDDGFLSLTELGFGQSYVDCDPTVLAGLRTALPAATVGDVLTLSTVTGTAAGTADLMAHYPDAVAETMEGFGVAAAAAQAGAAFIEIRTVSNLVGPRDRGAWRIPEALAALTDAVRRARPTLEAGT